MLLEREKANRKKRINPTMQRCISLPKQKIAQQIFRETEKERAKEKKERKKSSPSVSLYRSNVKQASSSSIIRNRLTRHPGGGRKAHRPRRYAHRRTSPANTRHVGVALIFGQQDGAVEFVRQGTMSSSNLHRNDDEF